MENEKNSIENIPTNISENDKPSHFSKNVITLVGGTALAQIITFLASPIITRLYGPDAFGILALFTSITGIFAVIACLRYELAIMLPKSDKEAANILGLCLLIVVFISILSIPFLILSQQILIQSLKISQLEPYFWFIPLSTFLSGIFLAMEYWNSRTKHFYRLSTIRVFKSVSTKGIQIGVGSAGFASGGTLISANIFGQIVSTSILGLQILKEHQSFFKQNITIKGMVAAFKLYIKFPKFDIWSALLGTISSMLPIFILSAYFNPSIVGYYSLSLMVLQLPMSLIGSAIGQVFFQKAAEAKNISQKKLRDMVEKPLKPLIFLVYFPTILLILIGPELFGAVFGLNWMESGNYARYMALWMSIGFISSPISTLFTIFQEQRFTLFFNIFQMVFRIIALLIGGILGDALISIILFSIVGCISNTIALLYLLKLSNTSIIEPVKIVLNFFFLSIPFIILVMIFQKMFFSNIFLIVILSLLVSLLYYVVVLKKDPELLGFLRQISSQIPVIKNYI